MTYNNLINSLAELVKISENDNLAGEIARSILQKELSEQNNKEIEILINEYYRNR